MFVLINNILFCFLIFGFVIVIIFTFKLCYIYDSCTKWFSKALILNLNIRYLFIDFLSILFCKNYQLLTKIYLIQLFFYFYEFYYF